MPFFQNVPVNTAKDWADEVKLFCKDRLKITNHKFMKQDNMKRCVIETDQPLTKINQTNIKKVSMVVKKKPRILEKEIRVVKQEPMIVKQEPSIVKQEPMIVKQEPRLVKQEPRFAKWEQRPIDLSVLTPMHLPYVHETPIDLSTTRLTSTPETALDLSTSGPSAMHLPSVHEAAIDLSTTGLTSIHTPSTPEVAMDLSTGPIDLSTFSH